MISRRKARRQALVLVYQWDLSANEIGSQYPGELDTWAVELAHATIAESEALDARISAASHDWTADRLGTVERSALRVAITELVRADVPEEVVIAEAVAFVKRYASEEGAKLVNGILGSIQRESGADTTEAEREETVSG